MSSEVPRRALQLRSLVRADQTLEVFLDQVDVPDPGPGDVVIRVEAAPVNPSDIGLLFARADLAAAVSSGTSERPVVIAPIPVPAMRTLSGRVGTPLPVGNEGAGTVVAVGSSPPAQALLGKVVAAAGGAMYSQYRCLDASLCLVLPEGTTAVQGASSFVNPMTALGMVETLRLEGHKAPRAHRSRLQPGPDAQPSLHRRSSTPRQHCSPARAGGDPQVSRRQLRLQFDFRQLHG